LQASRISFCALKDAVTKIHCGMFPRIGRRDECVKNLRIDNHDHRNLKFEFAFLAQTTQHSPRDP
jgi:hypothetical protein